MPDTQLAAAADIDPDKLDLFCERWSIPQRYRSYEEMLAQADVDIVSVCTLDNLHGPATIAAAEAGARGILCEKPMAFHLEEADRMIAACDRAGAKLVINHSMRFEANYINVQRMIEQGAPAGTDAPVDLQEPPRLLRLAGYQDPAGRRMGAGFLRGDAPARHHPSRPDSAQYATALRGRRTESGMGRR